MSNQQQQRIILGPDTSVSEAVTAVSQGKCPIESLVEWAVSTPIDLAQCGPLVGVVDGATFAEIMQAQKRLIESKARKSAESSGALRLKVSKRGAISLYGINSRMPVTLYAQQWERLASWLKAPADSPLAQFLAGNPTSEFSANADFKTTEDQAYLAGKPAHVAQAGDKVTVSVARK